MKLAAIDIGSNTIRLLVANVDGGEIVPLRHERRVTRLASGLHINGAIFNEPLEATVNAVREFTVLARQEGVQRIVMAGTSALREASNALDAVRAIEDAAGLHLDIISGQMEAEIMSLGVLGGLGPVGRAIIFDIGGGSTEFIALNGKHVLKAITFPAGVVRLTEECILEDPPSTADIERLDRQATLIAQDAREGLGGHVMNSDVLAGTAGTATTLASLDLELTKYDWRKVQGHILTLERIRELETGIQQVSIDIRKKIKGMDPERTDLIIAGTRLTIRIMEALDFSEMVVSDHGLLEGLIVKAHMETGQ